MIRGANRDVVDGYEACCPFRTKDLAPIESPEQSEDLNELLKAKDEKIQNLNDELQTALAYGLKLKKSVDKANELLLSIYTYDSYPTQGNKNKVSKLASEYEKLIEGR